MSATDQPSEEELRAAYEAEIKKIRVEQILLEQVVSIINLGMRRTGLAPGTEDERDIGQVRMAIEAVRALLPLLEQSGARAGGPDPRRPLAAADGVRPARRVARRGAGRGRPAPGAARARRTAGRRRTGPAAGAGAARTPGTGQPGADPTKPGEGGPAQRSGRLWVPGQ